MAPLRRASSSVNSISAILRLDGQDGAADRYTAVTFAAAFRCHRLSRLNQARRTNGGVGGLRAAAAGAGRGRLDPIVFVYGLDPIKKQKEAAYRRLLVRDYFALNRPADAPLMPTDEGDRRYAKYAGGLLGFITAHFIWSIERQDDLRVHPSFADFVSGMLWQHENNVEGCSLPYFPPEQLAELKRRFPPRKLEGLDCFSWRPPRGQNRAKKNRRAA